MGLGTANECGYQLPIIIYSLSIDTCKYIKLNSDLPVG